MVLDLATVITEGEECLNNSSCKSLRLASTVVQSTTNTLLEENTVSPGASSIKTTYSLTNIVFFQLFDKNASRKLLG